jgi:hypothetical protein
MSQRYEFLGEEVTGGGRGGSTLFLGSLLPGQLERELVIFEMYHSCGFDCSLSDGNLLFGTVEKKKLDLEEISYLKWRNNEL